MTNTTPFQRRVLFLLGGLIIWACLGGGARAQVRFIDRKYRVRVAVQENVRRVAVRGVQDYMVLNEKLAAVGQLLADETYFIDIQSGQPGDKTYRLVLQELDAHDVDAALALAERAKDERRLPVKVFRMPSREPGGGKILVTLGEFETRAAAQDYLQRWGNDKVHLIYEDRAVPTRGQVRLFDKSGAILAQDPRGLRLAPVDPATGDIAVVELDAGQWVVAGMGKARHYRGDLDMRINEEGSLTVVNDLWVEHYLYSVVSAEIGSFAPVEAMKAQAVAGRSEAVAKIERGIVSSTFFDFYDTAVAQSYPGRGVEDEVVREAVDATRGEILISGGKAVDAVYSHSCGGLIASAEDVWGGKEDTFAQRHLDQLLTQEAPNLHLWKDAFAFLTEPQPSLCNPDQQGFPEYAKKYYRWEKEFTGEEFSRLADAMYGTGPVKDVYIDERTPSGRIRQMRIIGVKKTAKITQELELRKALGGIYSTFYVLTKTHDPDGLLKRLRIYGGGFGHGVGMCQMGAYMMGRRGYNYRQILAHYFTGVEIRRLYR